MWIHIPSQYVPDTEESNWDSAQLCQELGQCATWSGKSKSPKSWQRVLKTESLTTHLSGLTLEPLMRQRGVEKFRSSLADFPASPIRSQATGKALTMNVSYQGKSSGSQRNSDTQLSFLRMFPESEDSTGITSDQNYKAWDTELKNSSLRRLRQVRHTDGTGFLFWPTPAARDYKGFDPPGKKNTRMDPHMYLSIHRNQPIHRDGSMCTLKCLRFSPLFAGWLMGLPQGYLDSSERLATASFRQWQQELGKFLTGGF